MTTPPLPEAGWYADPGNPQVKRYWTGSSWTEHVLPNPAAAVAPPPPPPPAQPAWQATVTPPINATSAARRSRKWPGIVVGVIALLVVIGVAANNTNDNSGVKSTPAGGTQGSGSSGSSAPAPSTAVLGQSIDLNGEGSGEHARLTFTQWVDPVHIRNGIDTPDRGMRYVAAQFRITDTGTAGYDDSPSNGAIVIDSQDQQYESTITAANGIPQGAIFGGDVKLQAGDSALGFIVFEVPTNATITKVQFGLDSGFGQTGEWVV